MKSMYNILAFLILLAIVGLFMYFVVSIETFDNDIRDGKIVNVNMLKHSVMIQDNVSEEYEATLNKDSLVNSIKYTEGMTWEKWVNVDNKEVLAKIEDHVKKLIEESVIGMNVIFCKLNRYRICSSDCDMLFLDYDIVLYDKGKKDADHGKLLCVFKEKRGIDIVHYRIVGKISEDQIYMKNDADVFDKEYASYKQQHWYVGDFIDSDDTRESMSSHDSQVKQLLYNKLVGETMTDGEEVDYIKNKEHDRAHKIVRNMFLNGLKSNVSTNDIYLYKKYPYKNDFTITC